VDIPHATTQIVQGIDAANGSIGVAKKTNWSINVGNSSQVPICIGLYGFSNPFLLIVMEPLLKVYNFEAPTPIL